MALTLYGQKKLLDHLTGVALWTPPALYISLHTASPGKAGSHSFEITTVSSGYVRQALIGIIGATDLASGFAVNTSAINFGPATVNWGTVVAVGIEDALTSGNMIAYGSPSSPRTITNGLPFQISAGDVRLRLD